MYYPGIDAVIEIKPSRILVGFNQLSLKAHQEKDEKIRAVADTFDQRPDVLEVARRVAGAMKEVYAFDKDKTTVLDYACGTGVVARHIMPHVKSVTGIDFSQGMVDIFNYNVARDGLDKQQYRAIATQLKGKDRELDEVKFDVAMCSMSYRHLIGVRPEQITQILASHLKPGGTLLVTDFEDYRPSAHWLPEDAPFSCPEYIIKTDEIYGFTENRMKVIFKGAGLKDFKFIRFTTAYRRGPINWIRFLDCDFPPKLDKDGKPIGDKVNFFLAKGVKA